MSRERVVTQELASDVPRPNLLQNGGFEQWHWGPGPFTINGAITADRWQISASAVALTVTRDTVNVDGSPVAAACVATAGAQYLMQLIDAGAQLSGRTVTLAVRVRTTNANAVRLAVFDSVNTWRYGSFHSGDGTWQTLTFTVTVAIGSTATYAAIYFAAAATAYVDNATLVLGTQYADYVPAISYPDSLPNERIASDLPRHNLLINGGFENWQRGNGPFAGNSLWGPDRWLSSLGSTATLSVVKDTVNYDAAFGGQACAALTYVQGGNSFYYQPNVESLRYDARGRTIAFSMRVRASAANAVRLFLDGAPTGRDFSAYHSGSGGYETLTVVASSPINGASIVACGVQLVASGTFYLDNAMLVPGTVPADFIPGTPADEVARCLRYYEVLLNGGGSDFSFRFYGPDTNTTNCATYTLTRKPIAPTATKNGTFTVSNGGQPVIYADITQSRVGVVPGAAGIVAITASTGCTFTYEANP